MICLTCKRDQPLDQYRQDNDYIVGYSPICRDCLNAHMRKYPSAFPGLTLEDEKQGYYPIAGTDMTSFKEEDI